MPCIIKQRTADSPGVITFTHNEALYGVPAKFKSVKKALNKYQENGEWLFGVHVQGDCSYLKRWPLEEWQAFIMWADQSAPFLSNVSRDRLLPMTCVNFMPDLEIHELNRVFDICVITRPSGIKRVIETLQMIRALFDRHPGLKVVFIAPDPRLFSLGEHTYKKQGLEKDFYHLPRKIFSCAELKNISFLCSSQETFGMFPLSSSLIADILKGSKFLYLASHLEGVPRVLAESFLAGTPCIVSNNLKSGLDFFLNEKNSLSISDDVEIGSKQIVDALVNYDRFFISAEDAKVAFSGSRNLSIFRSLLSQHIEKRGGKITGQWYLDDLHLRLACHGQKYNSQFMNSESSFFDWMARAESLGTDIPDDDTMFGSEPWSDDFEMSLSSIIGTLRTQFFSPILRRLSS